MRRFPLFTALFLLLALPFTAKADTLFTLQNGTFQSGATINGTLIIDTTSGQFVSAQLLYQSGSMTSLFTGPFTDPGEPFDINQFFGFIYDANGDLLLLDLPVSSLVNYSGGPLCSESNLCDDFYSYYQSADGNVDPFQTGNLVPTVVTPEPSSLMLLGTGFSGLLAFSRRKRR